MKSLLEALQRDLMSGVVGLGLGVAAVLIAIAWLTLPKDERRLVRLPLLLIVLHAVAQVARFTVASESLARLLKLSALFLLLAAIGRSAFLVVVRSMLARRLGFPLPRIVEDFIQIGVYLGVALLVLRAAGVEPGSLLATSALLTAVIGLSLQDTLGNMFAGLAIQAEQPFSVGDWIAFDDKREHIGQVVEINWRATKVRTLDLLQITVPNGVLAKAPIKNFSRPDTIVRRTTHIFAPNAASPQRVRALLAQAAGTVPDVLEHPEPNVIITSFSERGVEYAVRYFIRNFRERDVIGGLVNERLWYAMSREGLDIPAPRRHVELREVSETAERERREARAHARRQALERVDVLEPLSSEQMEQLAELAETRLYGAAERIIVQGEPGTELYIIQRGSVTVSIEKDRRSSVVAELGPGKFFGEMSLMMGSPRTASVDAHTECELIVVGKEAFRRVLEQNERVLTDISEILARRSNQLTQSSSEESADGERLTEPGPILQRLRKFFAVKPS